MTPTNVAQVQPTRSHRRSPSVSSMNARNSLSSSKALQRSHSVGSMMERTFRSPSPGRSPAPSVPDIPPLPTVPAMDTILARQRVKPGTHRRHTTLNTQPLRTASEAASRDAAHGSWFGGAAAGDGAAVRPLDPGLCAAANAMEKKPRLRSFSPSINFSYPRSRLRSSSPTDSAQSLVYDANSRRMVPRSRLLARSQSAYDDIDRPTNHKQSMPAPASGSHLHKGTLARTQAPALEASHPAVVDSDNGPVLAPLLTTAQSQDPSKGSKKKKQKKKKNKKKQYDLHDAPEAENSALFADKEPPSSSSTRPSSEPAKGDQNRVAGRQADEKVQQEVAHPKAASSAVQPRDQSPPLSTASLVPLGMEASKQTMIAKARPNRLRSESPAKPASLGTPVDQPAALRHEPPARSMSPRKSAMKPLSPTRTASSGGDEASSPGLGPNIVSGQDDASVSRKKSTRVSWDDKGTTVAGETAQHAEGEAQPIPSSPTKTLWHGIATKYGGKKDSAAISDDEFMTPRPALPLFGSVRERKAKNENTGERPLVRPTDRQLSSLTALVGSETKGEVTDSGIAADAAIGPTLTQDQASRNAANISKFREPLPASASATEGGLAVGDNSADDLYSSGSAELDQPISVPDGEPSNAKTTVTGPEIASDKAMDASVIISSEDSSSFAASGPANGQVSQAVSTQQQADILERRPEVPGGFPEDNSPRTAEFPAMTDMPPAHQAESSKPEGELNNDALALSQLVETSTAPIPVMDDIEEEEEENDRNSFYSDAREEIVDADGHGYLSLDAVVDGPSGTKAARRSRELAEHKDSEKKETVAEASPPPSTEQSTTATGQTFDEWEKAKAYWKSLSTGQRRQLEIEALSEIGDDEPPKTAIAKKKKDKKGAKVSFTTGEDKGPANKKKPVKRVSVVTPRPETGSGSGGPGPSAPPSSMKKSMRSGGRQPPPVAAAAAVAARKQTGPRSDNSSTGGSGMRKSLRFDGVDGKDGLVRPSLSQSGRPSSFQTPGSGLGNLAKASKRNASDDKLASRSSYKPSLRRRGSDESDSSFTRATRSSGGTKFGFRQSMRSGSRLEPPSPSFASKGSGRFSLRSLSPTSLRRNSVASISSTINSFGGGGGSRMRQSLRADSADSRNSRIGLSPWGRSGSRNRSKKTKSSRFADSSDEDDGPAVFSTRFADSSDEDERVKDRSAGRRNKARELPKSLRGGESSSRTATKNGGRHNNEQDSTLRRSRSGRGSLMPREETSRGSFMSKLQHGKRDGSGKIGRDHGESAARRDTKLERSARELATLRHSRQASWPLAEAADGAKEQKGDEGAGEVEADKEAGGVLDGSEGDAATSAAAKKKNLSSSPSSVFSRAFHRRRSLSESMVMRGGRSNVVDDDDEDDGGDDDDDNIRGDDGGSLRQPSGRKKKFRTLRKILGIHG